MMTSKETTLLQRTSLPGIAMWSRWQADRSMFFNSFFVEGEENLIVDPLALEDADLRTIEAAGGAAWIVVTTRDHERQAGALAQRLHARIAAPERDLKELTVKVERALRDGDTLGRARIVQFDEMKSPGELGLYLADCETMIVGDALQGDPPGSLRMVPDAKLGDPKRAALSLRRILALQPRNILMGDGHCVFGNATQALEEYLATRTDVLIHKINLDELTDWTERHGPGRLHRRQAEVGFLLGAHRLGYQVLEIAPGEWGSPLHGHTEEEELYVIFDGSGTIRFTFGEYPIRKGDVIALPTGKRGAHQLRNTGPSKLVVLALANNEPGDGCFYPDSDKLLFARNTMPRMVSGNRGTDLDYWDGESG
ncbi:cupin domain-containing protein [bacterium]|nr:MAG: cupin domain-containing protein [bacterium]